MQAVKDDIYSEAEIDSAKARNSFNAKPVEDVLDLAGTLKPKKNQGKSAVEAREAFEKFPTLQ